MAKRRAFYQREQWLRLTVDNCDYVGAELLANALRHLMSQPGDVRYALSSSHFGEEREKKQTPAAVHLFGAGEGG